MTTAELLYKPCQFQQIRHAEERPVLAYGDLRVRSTEIRPLRRNRANGRLIDSQQQTFPIAVVPVAHARELLAVKWMKRVCDAYKTHRCDRNTCTLE